MAETLRTDVLRTGDGAFSGLPGYPFQPRYAEGLPGYEGLRMHYLDEGPPDALVTFLCLHGQPTWSYLYRKMIPVFTQAGFRVIAPDWFGFGRSDKPAEDAVYTFEFHREAMLRLLERLQPKNITLVCQDWGGLLGLTLPMAMPERFTRLLVMNTALATGFQRPNLAFFVWRTYSNLNPNLNIAGLMRFSCRGITPEEARAYDAPFPDGRYKAGVRRFPRMVPTNPNESAAKIAQKAARWWRDSWHGESFMAIGAKDPILGIPAMSKLQETIRGCPTPLVLPNAGHFVQEDAGFDIAKAALQHFGFDQPRPSV